MRWERKYQAFAGRESIVIEEGGEKTDQSIGSQT